MRVILSFWLLLFVGLSTAYARPVTFQGNGLYELQSYDCGGIVAAIMKQTNMKQTLNCVKAGENLLPLIKNGTYSNLTNEVYKLRNETDPIKIENEIVRLANKYTSKIQRPTKKEVEPIEPKIIISETFVSK